jgi:hypothetical protein
MVLKLWTVEMISSMAFVIPRTICEMLLEVAGDDGSTVEASDFKHVLGFWLVQTCESSSA